MNRLLSRLVRNSGRLFTQQSRRVLIPALVGLGIGSYYYSSKLRVACESVGSVDGFETVTIPEEEGSSIREHNLSVYLENCVPPMRSAEETRIIDNLVYLAAKDADMYLLNATEDVFVLYASPHCDVCKMFKPVFVELASIFAEQAGIKFVIVDTKANYTPGYLDEIESFATPTVKVYSRGGEKVELLEKARHFLKDLQLYNDSIKEEFTNDNTVKRSNEDLRLQFKDIPVPGKSMPTTLTGEGIPYDILTFVKTHLTEPEILTPSKLETFEKAMERYKARVIEDMEKDEDTKKFLDEIVADKNVTECRPQAADLLYTLLTYNNKKIGEKQALFMNCVERYTVPTPTETTEPQPTKTESIPESA